jgi:hypothetical protein
LCPRLSDGLQRCRLQTLTHLLGLSPGLSSS